mgnify:FL=1
MRVYIAKITFTNSLQFIGEFPINRKKEPLHNLI